LWNEIVKQAKTHQGLQHRLKKKNQNLLTQLLDIQYFQLQ
jgi:hypothetical protein